MVDLPASNLITHLNSTVRTITQAGLQNSSAVVLPPGSVLISSRATIGRIAINNIPVATNQGFKNILIKDPKAVDYQYLAHALTIQVPRMEALASGATFKEISKAQFKTIEIPLPPLVVQQQLVTQIEAYQKVVDGCTAVIEGYKPEIPFAPNWSVTQLGEVCKTSSGGTPARTNLNYYRNGIIPWVKSGELAQTYIFDTEEKITQEALRASATKLLPANTVLLAMYGATVGETGILRVEAATNQAVCAIQPGDLFVPEFLLHFLQSKKAELVALSTGGAQPNISQGIVRDILVPLVPLDEQARIVANLQTELSTVENCRQLRTRMQARIQRVLGQVWQQEATGETIDSEGVSTQVI